MTSKTIMSVVVASRRINGRGGVQLSSSLQGHRRALLCSPTSPLHCRHESHSTAAGASSGSIAPPSLPTIERTAYWQKIGFWQDVSEHEFMRYSWQTGNTIDKKSKLLRFLGGVLPIKIRAPNDTQQPFDTLQTRDHFLEDVEEGMRVAPMAIRLTPHILSLIDWTNPVEDPIRRQFIPLKSTLVADHYGLTLDSLHETDDAPVEGLVHRYPDKVLFLATSVCPVYCRFCTRSYAVGSNTESVTKATKRPTLRRWNVMFDYIEQHPAVQDVVVSGGDSYYLSVEQLTLIGEKLLSMPNIKRIRFATKGLAVNPIRILDDSDGWTDAFVALSIKGRAMGKQVAMHTHFNHPHEITWITELAARRLFEAGVIVRNQTVILKGVNDTVETMSKLIRMLADLNIQPYYVYQSDMVRGIEDLRTPLSTILHLEKHIRGTIAGFMCPAFVVDLPGGGGKRLANSYESYDEGAGVSKWKAPGVTGEEVFEYYDPISRSES